MSDLKKNPKHGRLLSDLFCHRLEKLRAENPLPAIPRHADPEETKRAHDNQLSERAKNQLAHDISSNLCFAEGRAKHLAGHPFVRIRPEIAMEMHLQPERDTIQWGSEIYDRVRIVELTSEYRVDAPQQARTAIPRNPGRKPSAGISEAITYCLASVPSFAKMTREQQCDCVRDQLFKGEWSHKDIPKGYTDSAIKKRLRELSPS